MELNFTKKIPKPKKENCRIKIKTSPDGRTIQKEVSGCTKEELKALMEKGEVD